MDKKKIEIVKCQNRAENALFWDRDAPFYKYKNRAASPMEGGQPSNKKRAATRTEMKNY